MYPVKWAKTDEKRHLEDEKVGQPRTHLCKIQKSLKIGGLWGVTKKRLTDFFGKNGWKLGGKGVLYVKRQQKYCCCTWPMRNWHLVSPFCSVQSHGWNMLYLTYEELTLLSFERFHFSFLFVPSQTSTEVVPDLWGIDTYQLGANRIAITSNKGCTWPMRNWHVNIYLLNIS